MKRIYCDVCGTLIPTATVQGTVQESLNSSGAASFASFTACPGVEDICDACRQVGKDIDVEAMVLKEWQKLSKVGEKRPKAGKKAKQKDAPQTGLPATNAVAGTAEKEKPERRPRRGTPAPTIKADAATKSGPGSHWAKKKYIHAQLQQYREQEGLGSVPALARKADVPEEILRKMLESMPVPIESWRQVGAALDDLGIVPEGFDAPPDDSSEQ